MSRFESNGLNIVYHGDAVPSVGAIEMNKVNYLCRVGWATYVERVPLWDSNTGNLSDFTTHFSFIIDTQGSPSYGHGVTFFLAPVGFEIPPNSAGGFLGLFNTTNSDSSQNQIVLVEFDSFVNPEWDPPVEHVGINNNSISSAVYTNWNASLHSGDTADVWINYNASAKNLSVSWTYQKTSNSQENTNLSYNIDLMKVLPEWVTIGISAATGAKVERHTIKSWEFSSSLDIKVTSGKKAENNRLIVVLTVSGGVLIAGVIVAFITLWLWKGKKKVTVATSLTSINDDLERGAGPRRKSVNPMGKDSEMGLVEWIWNLYGKGDLLFAMDEKLHTDFDEKQVECLMIIGLWCSHPDRNLRPSMRQAIQVLKFETTLPNLPTQMPVLMYHAPLTIPPVSSSEPSITTSLQHGR
ncbi:L-type lectin-domain containing receptor kinase IX.1-like [Fagus crenata]